MRLFRKSYFLEGHSLQIQSTQFKDDRAFSLLHQDFSQILVLGAYQRVGAHLSESGRSLDHLVGAQYFKASQYFCSYI